MNLFFLSHKRRKSPDHSFFFFSFFFFSPRALFLGRKMRSKRKNFLDESQSVGKLQQITLKREIFRVFTKHPCSDRLSATFYDTFVDFNPLFIQNICNFQLREFFRGTQKKSLENFPLFFRRDDRAVSVRESERRFFLSELRSVFFTSHLSRDHVCEEEKT